MASKEDFFLATSAGLAIIITLLGAAFVIPVIILATGSKIGFDTIIVAFACLLLFMFLLKLVLSIPLFNGDKYEGIEDRRLYDRRVSSERREQRESDEDRRKHDRRKADRLKKVRKKADTTGESS